MNANQIINMVMRVVMRKVINGGVNAGVNAVSSKMSKGKSSDAPAHDTAVTQKQMRQTMKATRRMSKF